MEVAYFSDVPWSKHGTGNGRREKRCPDGEHKANLPEDCGCSGWDKNENLSDKDVEIERKRSRVFYKERAKDVSKDQPWARHFCGGTVLHRLANRGMPDNDPFWVVKTFGTDIIDGHGGIANPSFLLF